MISIIKPHCACHALDTLCCSLYCLVQTLLHTGRGWTRRRQSTATRPRAAASRISSSGFQLIRLVQNPTAYWQGLNEEEAERINSSKGGRVEILEQDGYISVAAGRFKGYQVRQRCWLFLMGY